MFQVATGDLKKSNWVIKRKTEQRYYIHVMKHRSEQYHHWFAVVTTEKNIFTVYLVYFILWLRKYQQDNMIIAYQSLAYHVKTLYMFDVMLQSVLEIDNGKLINIKNTYPGF